MRRLPPHDAPTPSRSLPITALALVALTLAACTAEDAALDGDDSQDADDRISEIVDNLEQAGFAEDDITIDDEGQVVVGGDAVVTLEASREMIGLTRLGDAHDEDESFRHYRTTVLIDAAIDNICINGYALNGHANLSAGLDAAIANYNNQNLTFNMTRINTPLASGCDVVITMSILGTGTGAQAGFPAGGLPYRTVTLGSGIGSFGVAVSTHVLTHELGHCIGLRHTDYYDRGISSCPVAGNEGQTQWGAHHIPNTPTTAVPNGSIMNACYNAGSTGVWNPEDIDALHQLYGRDCCASGSGAGCGNVAVNECVGAVDPYCNDVAWDSQCVSEVTSLGCGTCTPPAEHGCCSTGGAGCTDNVIEAAICGAGGIDGAGSVDPYCCSGAWDGACVAGVNALPNDVALPCGSTCCSPHGTAGCDDAGVQACVGAVDPYCTTTAWDNLCVTEVETLGCSRCA